MCMRGAWARLSAYSEFAAPAHLAQPGASQAQPGRPTQHFISRNTRLAAARAMCLADLGQVEEARVVVGPLLDDVVDRNDDEPPRRDARSPSSGCGCPEARGCGKGSRWATRVCGPLEQYWHNHEHVRRTPSGGCRRTGGRSSRCTRLLRAST